jgi:hypothetical protein
MTVALIPQQGGWHIDSKRPGHYLRVSGHQELGLVVVSVWRDGECVATHELPTADVPDVIALFAKAVVPPSASGIGTLPSA